MEIVGMRGGEKDRVVGVEIRNGWRSVRIRGMIVELIIGGERLWVGCGRDRWGDIEFVRKNVMGDRVDGMNIRCMRCEGREMGDRRIDIGWR